MLPPAETPLGKIGLAFARALVAGDFDAAYRLLSSSLQAKLSPRQLQEEFESMIENWSGVTTFVENGLDYVQVWDDWPDKAPMDIGDAYVAIVGKTADGMITFVEAVTVRVSQEQTKQVIREIEWGRP